MTDSDMSYLTVALPKGKLFARAAELLAQAGYTASDLCEDSRKLVLTDEPHRMRFIITKPMDLPTYVEYGAADMGIIGKDVLLEERKDVYELLDLGFGRCRMVAAVPEARRLEKLSDYVHMRVATKYPLTAERYFQRLGMQMEIIRLHGSIELAPMVGLAELIVDLVETGRTLRENRLVEIAQVHVSTARLIANRVSYKLKFTQVSAVMAALRRLTAGGEAS